MPDKSREDILQLGEVSVEEIVFGQSWVGSQR